MRYEDIKGIERNGLQAAHRCKTSNVLEDAGSMQSFVS
jgi:hypothetical protein